jgi:hypothetical protein
VLESEEVRQSRFADNYSFNTKLLEPDELTPSSGDDDLIKEIKKTQEMLKVRPGFASTPFGSGQQNMTMLTPQEKEQQAGEGDDGQNSEDKNDNLDVNKKSSIKNLLQKIMNLVTGG